MTVDTKARNNTLPMPVREVDGRWQSGTVSPNPSGRPAVPIDVKLAAKAYTQDMVEVLAEVALNPKSPPASRVAAANALLDRGHGRPLQSIDASVEKVDFNQIYLEALKALTPPSKTLANTDEFCSEQDDEAVGSKVHTEDE